jgi:hypothetical protein
MSCIVPSPFKFVHAVFFSLQNCPLASNLTVSESMTQSLSDEEPEPQVEEVEPIDQFPKCLVPDCTETAYFGFQSSGKPLSCLKHCHPNHIDFRQKGVYILHSLFTMKLNIV